MKLIKIVGFIILAIIACAMALHSFLTYQAEKAEISRLEELGLHQVAVRGMGQGVEILLERGADVNAKDNLGRTPLAALISESYKMYERVPSDALNVLLKHGADPNATEENGVPVLILAVRMRDRTTVEKLLNGGADWRIPDQSGRMAADYETSPEVKMLLDASRK